MDNYDQSLEKMMGKLGDFGRYQCFQFMLHVVSAIPTGMQMLSLVTVAGVPDHRCAINGIDSSNHTEPWNSSLVLNAIPLDEKGRLDSCKVYVDNNTLAECQSWVYDSQYYTSSRGIEWNFVCDRRWMGAIAQTVFMSGVVVGSLILGPLCDKFGRKIIFVWAANFQLLFGIVIAFITEYYTYVVIRFIYGIFAIGSFKAGYVLFIELIGPSKRTLCAALFQILFGFGVMLLGIWGYFIDDRFYLQIIYALHSILLLPHWYLMDESPRWLWAKGRVDESVAIVAKALSINRSSDTVETKTLLSNCELRSKEDIDNLSSGTIDLFRTPNMLKKTVIICGCWFANAVVYYGLSFNTGKLSGNPYLMLFISGLVEVPGYIIAMSLVSRVGHRSVLSTTMLLGGTSLLIVLALPFKSVASTAFIMLGKLIVSGSLAIVYKYGAELFPTVVRSSGVGLGSMFASLAGALSPLITLLDSFDPTIPTTVFGLLAMFFGTCSLFLPETMGHCLPQTMADGERFGVGDTCFTNCRGRKLSETESSVSSIEIIQHFRIVEK